MDTACWRDSDEFLILDLVAQFRFRSASSLSFQLGKLVGRDSPRLSEMGDEPWTCCWKAGRYSSSSAGSTSTTHAKVSTVSNSESGCRIGMLVGSRCGTWYHRSRPRWGCLPTSRTISCWSVSRSKSRWRSRRPDSCRTAAGVAKTPNQALHLTHPQVGFSRCVARRADQTDKRYHPARFL
jgi:hypothetical protein